MKTRKELPLVAKLNNIKVDIDVVLKHCAEQGLLDDSKYGDIKYSSNSSHQRFLISNEFCKTNFFTEIGAPLMEGEQYKQLYLTDFDETKASNRVELHGTNIFERTKRLNPDDPRYLPEADERNYGVRNQYATGPFKDILDSFSGQITRVRLAYLKAGFTIRPHVDYDPSYITRFHIPLITNPKIKMGFHRDGIDHEFYLPADGTVYFFNSGVKHWVKNESDQDRIHLIIDTHGQQDLADYDTIAAIQ